MSEPDEYEDYYDDGETTTCPRCNGDGSVNCYCGGDQCYCDNYGDAPCPLCHEEGDVPVDVYERYVKGQREMRAQLMKMWEPAQ